MKKLKTSFSKISIALVSMTILATGLWACSSDDTATSNNTTTEQTVMSAKAMSAKERFTFVEMLLPKEMLSYDNEFDTVIENVVYKSEEGEETEGQVRLRIPHEGFKIVSIEFSENLLEAAKITEDYFIQNADLLLQAYGNPEEDKDKEPDPCCPKTHGERIKECYEMEKGEGRGWCVAGEFIATIGEALKGIFKR